MLDSYSLPVALQLLSGLHIWLQIAGPITHSFYLWGGVIQWLVETIETGDRQGHPRVGATLPHLADFK